MKKNFQSVKNCKQRIGYENENSVINQTQDRILILTKDLNNLWTSSGIDKSFRSHVLWDHHTKKKIDKWMKILKFAEESEDVEEVFEKLIQ